MIQAVADDEERGAGLPDVLYQLDC
jgi:hypothetical protein